MVPTVLSCGHTTPQIIPLGKLLTFTVVRATVHQGLVCTSSLMVYYTSAQTMASRDLSSGHTILPTLPLGELLISTAIQHLEAVLRLLMENRRWLETRSTSAQPMETVDENFGRTTRPITPLGESPTLTADQEIQIQDRSCNSWLETRFISTQMTEAQVSNCGRTTRPTFRLGKSLTFTTVKETVNLGNTCQS